MIVMETTVQAVTVYLDRARVTRVGRCDVQVGVHEIAVENLPPILTTESLRAAGRGTARARLLSVEGEKTHYVRPAQENVAELSARLDQLQDQDGALAQEERNAEAHAEFLAKAATSAAENLPKGLAFARANMEQVTQFGEWLQEENRVTSERLRQLGLRRRDLQREIEKVQRELAQVQSPRATERYRAVIAVEVTQPGALELELVYVVPRAGWQPLYDLRVEEGDASPSVQLTYLGQIWQKTGEDWVNAALTLSTAKPAVTAQLPELSPWYIGPPLPPPSPTPRGLGAPAMMRAMSAEAPQAGVAMEEEKVAAPEMMAPMEAGTAEVRTSSAAVSYEIRQRVSVPSDGEPHNTTVAILPLPAQLDFLTAPKRTSYAYRRAMITNQTEYILLPGQLNIFWGAEYIGTGQMKNVAPGQEFEAFLGIDERVRVERKLTTHEVDKRLLGNRRRMQFGYRITLENLLPHAIRITARDQIPVSRHEDIKVQLSRSNPLPTEEAELGILKWELTLAAREKRDIEFEFVIESPKEMTLVGLPA